MYVLSAGFILLALNRLPFKLPNAKGPGRRHKAPDAGGHGLSGPPISFADVAGVDEAKEELAEIVVGGSGV